MWKKGSAIVHCIQQLRVFFQENLNMSNFVTDVATGITLLVIVAALTWAGASINKVWKRLFGTTRDRGAKNGQERKADERRGDQKFTEERIEIGSDDITGFSNEPCVHPGVYQSALNPLHKIGLQRGELFPLTPDKYGSLQQTTWILIQPHND